MEKDIIKLTGSTLPVIVLYVTEQPSDILLNQLTKKVSQSPQFFNHSPIVIDLGNLPSDRVHLSLDKLVEHCRELGLQPIAFKNVDESLMAQATALPIIAGSKKDKPVKGNPLKDNPAPEQQESASVEPAEKIEIRTSKVITHPIRSGQQVYAEGTDLIVLAQVSEGSEVIADGNIHIYGTLRGKALAGVKGNTNARIFCQRMQAELIAIAGHFLLSDNIDEALTNKAVQASLKDEQLIIDTL